MKDCIRTKAKHAAQIKKSGKRSTAYEAAVRDEMLALKLGNGEVIELPVSVLGDSPSGLVVTGKGAKADLSKPRLEEWGYGISFGANFDCGIDTLVMEHDFLHDPENFEDIWYEPVLQYVEKADKKGSIMREMRKRLSRRRG